MRPTSVNLRELVPRFYERRDITGEWLATLQVLEDVINLILSGNASTGYDPAAAAESIDAMVDVRDPTRAPAYLLPYLSQALGWEMDPDTSVALQRKIVTVLHKLWQEKGTDQGIVDALRLLLGVEATVRSPWAASWQLNHSKLGTGTIIGPARKENAYALGGFVASSKAGLVNTDNLFSPAWGGTEFEVQVSASAFPDLSFGWMRAPVKQVLRNNIAFSWPRIGVGGGTYWFEFQVDDSYVLTPTQVGLHIFTIDIRAAVDAEDVATAIAAVTTPEFAGGASPVETIATADFVKLTGPTGLAGNFPITGTALEALSILGMVGGTAGAGAFIPSGGKEVVNLTDATGADDVAARIGYAIAFVLRAQVEVVQFRASVSLRNLVKGASGNGALNGTLATTKFTAVSGMSGGVGVSRAVMSFVVTFPRHLTPDELRAAEAIITAMKRRETHFLIRNPRDPDLPLFVLGASHLNSCRLTRFGTRSYRWPTGHWADDKFGSTIGRSRVALLGAAPVRLPRLIRGSSYVLEVDADSYVRQGNRQVAATTNDALLPAKVPLELRTSDLRNAFVSALRVAAGAPAKARITRIEGGSL